jgi:serine/threonine-protein phosphatase 2A activator
MLTVLPEELKDAAPELAYYWVESFGNATRIDYGTGHEMFMAAWLCCLEILGATQPDDHAALILRCFNQYLILMRRIQRTYMLEPAGSHGVWSLDDYQALPFVFGSAQLLPHKHISPKGIRQKDIVENFSDDYMYLACVKFVLEVKTGPFSEHSPILAQSGDAESWAKVHQGMLRIYFTEVLGKYPVMQHFLFGSILPFDPTA